MVEAQAVWHDGERFITKASSGHALLVDSDRISNTASGPDGACADGVVRLHGYGCGQHPAQEA